MALAAWIQFGRAAELLAANKLDLNALMKQARTPGFKAIPLQSTLSAHLSSTLEPFDGQNVVAKLPSSAASRQAILYTAHFDHLGINPAQSGDNIYNGAIDNATGDAMLLEVARAFTAARRRRTRSTLPRSMPKSRVCSARSTWRSTRRCRPAILRWT